MSKQNFKFGTVKGDVIGAGASGIIAKNITGNITVGAHQLEHLLQMQGMINGFQPFMMGIYIQSQQGNTFYATGMDGFAYTLNKV